MALQDAASGGNNLAGGTRDEAQPQPDRDGQGDLGRCCGALCGWAWIGTRLVGPLEKPSGSANPIQPGLVLLLCSARTFPLRQLFPRMWGWRWVLMEWTHPLHPNPSQESSDGNGSLWDGHIPSIPTLHENSVTGMGPHRMGTSLPSQPFIRMWGWKWDPHGMDTPPSSQPFPRIRWWRWLLMRWTRSLHPSLS